MAKAVRSISNADHIKELALIKRIKIEQTFAQQVYANFKSLKFGIETCCYTDFEQAVIRKDICDWQNSAKHNIVVATNLVGIFIEPLAKVNLKASMSCPETPSNVCTILDLEEIIITDNTYTQCFESASDTWVINHDLARYPSVTVVDSANTIVVGNVNYTSTNSLVITFDVAFSGCVFLN